MEKVVIMGMGYVGFPTACAIAKSRKYEVWGYDIDPSKIEKIKNGISPIDDEIAQKDLNNIKINATLDENILKNAKFILVCVPTPIYDDHTPNLGPVKSATATIAKHLSKGQNIIIESTINPGICEEELLPILEKNGMKIGTDFELGHCPERINPGDDKWNIYNIPRNVGATTPKGTKIIADFYRDFLDVEVNEMKDIRHAEATKIVENSFRDINIAFVNELAKSFDRLGLDITEVIRGSSNKPFAFMPHFPGCGVGGHCIPVDPYYLIERAAKSGFDHKFLKIARTINNGMPRYTVKKLMLTLNTINKSLKGTKVALLGLSYKKDIEDLRESPALELLKLLNKFEADVNIYEPYNLEKSRYKTLEETLENSEVILLATNHTEFLEKINKESLEKHDIKIIIDGRNCIDKKQFKDSSIIYKGIGR